MTNLRWGAPRGAEALSALWTPRFPASVCLTLQGEGDSLGEGLEWTKGPKQSLAPARPPPPRLPRPPTCSSPSPTRWGVGRDTHQEQKL